MYTPGESDAYITELYGKYYKTLERMCYRFVSYNAEYGDIISDCIQETFLAVEKAYGTFNNQASLVGWLIKTCQHRLLPKLREEIKRKKQIAFSMDAENTPVVAELLDSVDNWICKEDARECIDQIYQLLTDAEQRMMQNFFVQGLSMDEIAQEEHTSKIAVKSTIHRIRKKAKAFFKENF
jgi:RNA polymerase sigma factor (sigma-70 family)